MTLSRLAMAAKLLIDLKVAFNDSSIGLGDEVNAPLRFKAVAASARRGRVKG